MPPIITLPPAINGHRFDYTSVKFFIGARRSFEVKDINYKHSLKLGKVRGTSAVIRGRTRGIYDADGNFTMYKSEYQLLVQELAAQGPYMEVNFDIFCSYSERGSSIIKDDLLQCRITDDEDGHSEGGEGLVVKATIDIFRLMRNGFSAVTESLF